MMALAKDVCSRPGVPSVLKKRSMHVTGAIGHGLHGVAVQAFIITSAKSPSCWWLCHMACRNLHMLSAAGVQLVPFSPLHDSKLPPGLSAVLLGSGSVAERGQQLAANRPMLEALRAFAAAGGLVMGEGAALMYLALSLQRPGQQQHAMGELVLLVAAIASAAASCNIDGQLG
jgi:hypothetical protein